MQEQGLELEVRWLPYELNEDTPEEGIPLSEYYGVTPDRVASMQTGLQRRAAELGLPFRAPEMLSNTRKAHRLAEYAREQGKLEPLHRALFHAHFVEGRNLADDEVLRELARAAQLDPAEALAALDDPRYGAAVEANLQRARDIGVTGVPTFLVDGRYKIVGAQPYAELRDILLRIAERGL